MLQVLNLRKEYPGVLALDDVSITFENGCVHALIGKNGAGKSTVVKILAGAVQPTSGRILADGVEMHLPSPQDAFNKGIVTVHQELSLAPELTVAENILLGRLPKRKGCGGIVIDWAETFRRAGAVLDEMEVALDVRQKASDLGVAQQQIVEIAKAMSFRPSAIMLDEPTSALAQHETQSLFKLIRQLAAKGVTIIYITHRLQELHLIANKVSVLRDGRYVGTVDIQDATPDVIVEMMFGEVVQKQRPSDLGASSEPVLEARNLRRGHHFENINFTLYRGEVLGIAGMLGSGRTELLKAIFGAEPFESGEIVLAGRTLRHTDPVTMKRLGMAFTPENRKEEALALILSIRQNMCMAGMERIAPRGFITRGREKKSLSPIIEQLQIKVSDVELPAGSLSGGNQQKVVVGNWLGAKPSVILFDEPTRGIDVQAKQQIFQVMWDLSRQGISCVFVSSELEELLEACHRILIMKKGRIVEEVQPNDLTPNELYVKCMEN
ncbi:MAG: sugar ABC transporter ATP-binding protein [Candidatus Sumerlaeota bacterium]|nr:sugar ABC transporter ATP-binding protein [Candidatus Sumerlaeota bacterium]